nr:hypothetical protein [Desulfonatronospira sp.]
MSEDNKKMNLDGYESEILEAYEQGRLSPSYSQTDFQAIMGRTCTLHVDVDNEQIPSHHRKLKHPSCIHVPVFYNIRWILISF